jgi:hypothetical protein
MKKLQVTCYGLHVAGLIMKKPMILGSFNSKLGTRNVELVTGYWII